MGKTVVLGASPNPARFSHKAVKSLLKKQQEVVAVGFKEGIIVYDKDGIYAETAILKGTPPLEDVETVSIYIGSSRQEPYYEYIYSLKPKRVIFNPGTVNAEFMGKLRHAGIEPLSECMLVMLKEDKF